MAYKFVNANKQDIQFDNDIVYTHLLDIKNDAETIFENSDNVKPQKIEIKKNIVKKNYNILVIFIMTIIIIILLWYISKK